MRGGYREVGTRRATGPGDGAGYGERMRPVLMTVITTIVGLIPLARSGATVAGVYIDSIAVAVIGGLATSTIFTLLALPA